MQVMNVVWSVAPCSVRDVVERLNCKLAYTTVMTTLDRLFKKGLLEREKSERAFLYSPLLSSQDWERRRAGDLVAGFLSGRIRAISCSPHWSMPLASMTPCCWTNWKRRSQEAARAFQDAKP